MKIIFVFFCIVLSNDFLSEAQECDKPLMCERARQFTRDMCGIAFTGDTLLGPVRQGKMGPRGLKGERGEAAVINYESIMQTIRQTYDSRIDALIAKDEKMEETIRELQSENIIKQRENNELLGMMNTTIHNLESRIDILMTKPVSCKVDFEGKCFWAILNNSVITYAEAESICGGAGGRPAVIYNEDHYELILKYVRSLMETDSYLWLGLEINPMTLGVVTLPQRSPAPFVKWRPGYPRSRTSNTGVKLRVRTDYTDGDIGMYNYGNRHTDDAEGVVCEL